MANQLTGSFITIDQSNINTSKTSVQQLVDVVQSDIASVSSNTRKSYEVFTSGGVDQQTFTSSLFQTVHDQEFNLGTSNPLFDVTIGSLMEKSADGNTITVNNLNPTEDGGGKLIFTDSAKLPMMREKVSIYKQFAQNLLGDADSTFFLPHDVTAEAADITDDQKKSGTTSKKIRGAIFLCFRRLFTRDNIRKGSFGLKIYKNANRLFSEFIDVANDNQVGSSTTNLTEEITIANSANTAQTLITDVLSATNTTVSPVSGEISTLTDSSGSHVGLIFYDSGIIILDVERTFDPDQYIRGEITSTRRTNLSFDVNGPFAIFGRKDGQNAGEEKWYYPVYKLDDTGNTRVEFQSFIAVKDDASTEIMSVWYHADGDNQINDVAGGDNPPASGLYPIWSQMTSAQRDAYYDQTTFEEIDEVTLHNGKLYPSLWTSGTIDGVIDHLCDTRFGRDQSSSIAFRNETAINSSLIFCRAAPSQLNYSTNPSYTNSDGEIIALNGEEPFCFVTTVGLYDANGDLLAVAKTSRPIEKNPETDLSIRIRLDY